ncbi:thymidylate kinase isoform X2 [Ricinus communis]|uniref:Thymidylate kinase n=1 Tax=Ricinus communis TaxID=3988 RepID=B9RBN0_RICCO|nr:thymidylate kinase isoform X2 [Ricinus communis]EEF50951.1 thymidylate kinase, putative [Ricinus communis]|eukprot:XP_002509564.1 thymidylate kinase isoform X2 [Ricinus communis]
MTYACALKVPKALTFGASAARRSLNAHLNYPGKSSIRSIRMESDISTGNLRVENCESRGAFIVLEGLDRSGKTSQCGKLVSYLERLGHETELWRFPDRTTTIGQMISAYLSNQSQLDDRTIHLLYSANRWEKNSLMETKLKSGTTLIVDRYSYSGVAFSAAKGLDFEWCKAPEIGLLAPDLVLYLDIPPEKAAERGGYGGERYEKLEFQMKVGNCYQTLRDSSWEIIDASQPMEEVQKQIQEIVLDHVLASEKGKPLSHLWQHK